MRSVFSSLNRRSTLRARCLLAALWAIGCIEIDSRKVLPEDGDLEADASGGSLNGQAAGSSNGGATPSGGGASTTGGRPPASAGGAPAAGRPNGGAGHGGSGKGGASGRAGAPSAGSAGKPGVCVPLKGDATEPLIDDFEDGNNVASKDGGRLSYWFTFGDDMDCTVEPPADVAFTPITGGALTKLYSGDIKGTGCTGYGSTLAVDFNRNNNLSDLTSCPYDVRPYTGISFYFKTTRAGFLYVLTMQTHDKAFGGLCDPALGKCEDNYHVVLPLTTAWTLKTVLFKDLTQIGFGQATAFDPSQVIGIRFQVGIGASASDPYDLAVDDIHFVVN